MKLDNIAKKILSCLILIKIFKLANYLWQILMNYKKYVILNEIFEYA